MRVIKTKLKELNIQYQENVSLKEKTWIKTGGVVSLWIMPNSVDSLIDVIEILRVENTEFELVGHTSNIYYLDSYNPTIIISTVKIRYFKEEEDYIECACGTPVTVFSRYCVERGYKSYYGLVNLPGTVGAAICNNSSCFDCSLSEHLISALFFDLELGKVVNLTPHDFNFTYRNSRLKNKDIKGVILSVNLDKKQGVVDEEKAKAHEVTLIRKNTQEAPSYTLGSVYAGLTPKNNLLGKIARVCGGMLKITGLYTKRRYIRFVLLLYGFYDIKDFVSDKVVNTFKWLPNRTDKHEKFQRYQSFIAKAYKNPKLEIEIRCR